MKYNNDYDLMFKYKKKEIKIFSLKHKEEIIYMKRNDNNNFKI